MITDEIIDEIIASWDMEAVDILPAGSTRQEEIVSGIFQGFPRTCFRCDDYVECPW